MVEFNNVDSVFANQSIFLIFLKWIVYRPMHNELMIRCANVCARCVACGSYER